eukprot:TRINITY_DN3382_c0_g1_i1.p1 TRINITY_DN3382_c0_g1~~TRINITY_DN3382_c0_g1_i1.p1  ORF type:complete len:495 (+),score=207.23 TRINITY_DN3382_c0_g1_i1:646-2130(+)
MSNSNSNKRLFDNDESQQPSKLTPLTSTHNNKREESLFYESNEITQITKPIIEYSQQEEATLIRKIDLRLVPWISWVYLLSFLDRSNIGNVRADLIEELNLNEKQFGFAVGVFYFGYILFEIPSNLILKSISPSLWIGLIVCAWGICSTLMIFAHDFVSLIIIRVFLGISESGFFPGMVFYFTLWYKSNEQGYRIALFFCSSALAGAFGGVLAYYILQIPDGSFALQAWQWLFIIEGIPSIISGFITCCILPNYPHNSNWLDERERSIATHRLESNNNLNLNEKKVDKKQIFSTMTSGLVWNFAILYFCAVTPLYSISFYTPAMIMELGYSKLQANLLSSPIFIVTAIVIVLLAKSSDKTKERAIHIIICSSTAAIGFALLSWSAMQQFSTLSYAAMFLTAPFTNSLIPIILAWLNNSMQSSTANATAAGLVVGFGNLGGIVGPNLYSLLYIEPSTELPRGSFALAHMAMAIILISCSIVAFFLRLKLKNQQPN